MVERATSCAMMLPSQAVTTLSQTAGWCCSSCNAKVARKTRFRGPKCPPWHPFLPFVPHQGQGNVHLHTTGKPCRACFFGVMSYRFPPAVRSLPSYVLCMWYANHAVRTQRKFLYVGHYLNRSFGVPEQVFLCLLCI